APGRAVGPTRSPSAAAPAARARPPRPVRIVEPRVQQLRPQPQFVGDRADLLTRQDPANGSLLELSAEDPKSSSGHRSSPGDFHLSLLKTRPSRFSCVFRTDQAIWPVMVRWLGI